MSETINYRITATDLSKGVVEKAAARVDGMTKRIMAMTAPMETARKNMARFGDLGGMTKRVDSLADSAMKVGEGFMKAIEPMAVLTSAASIGGVIRLSQAWADAGTKIMFASQNLGMSTSQFQTITNAGQLAGVSIDTMNSGLESLGQNMWNAAGGRDPGFMAAMRQMHINFQNSDMSMKSYSTLLPQIANKIKSIHDPFAQAAIATQMFGSAGADMLPFLRQGAAGIAKLEAAATSNGMMTPAQIAAANGLRQSYTNLSQSLTGSGGLINQIEAGLSPLIQPMIDKMTAWTHADQDWVNTKMPKYVHDLGVEIKNIDWTQVNNFLSLLTGKSVASNVLNAINAFAQHPVAGIDAGGQDVMGWMWKELGGGGGKAPIWAQTDNFLTPKGRARSAVRAQGMAYFESKGWSKAHAAAIMANVDAESRGGDPTAVNPSSGAAGLFQLLGDRAKEFQNVFGVTADKGTPAEQFAFAQWELTHTEKAAALALHNSANAGVGAMAFNDTFERNGIGPDALWRRADDANYIFGLPDSVLSPAPPPAAIGASLADHQGSDGMKLDVHFHNAPPGTSTNVSGGKLRSLRIETAMTGHN